MNESPIHPWRWRMLALWVVIFTAIVFWAVYQNRNTISQINHDKASITSLEHTNCGLRRFLTTAEAARVRTANREHGKRKRNDLVAARGYAALRRDFPIDDCQRFHLGG